MSLHKKKPLEISIFHKDFYFVWISNLLGMDVPDEAYSRNAEVRRANDIYRDPRVIM